MSQPIHFGQFEIVSRIGMGGMGEVFRARLATHDGGPEVALKLLRSHLAIDPRFRRMFLAEASIGTLLRHPNLVRVVAHGKVGPQHFLAQELVDGVSLDRLLTAGPLPPALAAQVALGVLDGLEYAHGLKNAKGKLLHLVHRDVSPANVLVSRSGEVKLADFGVAKLKGLSLTMANELKGKRAYMAPEQLQMGAVLDRRVDLFAVGALLHKLVTGRVLFADVDKWLDEGARADVDGPLADVIVKAMTRDPAGRFATAAEMAAAIRAQVDPPAGVAAELGARVAAVEREERAVDPFERLILAELAEAVQAATPTPHDASVSNPVIPLLRDGGSARSTENTVPLPTSTGPASSRSLRLWLGGAAAAAVFALTVLLVVLHGEPSALPPPLAEAPSIEVPPPRGPEAKPLSKPEPEIVREPARPVVTRVAPASRASPGYLTLVTDPWAVAWLGSRQLGVTPFVRVKLPPGRHVLRLDLEQSGRSRPLAVQIVSGAENRLSIRLP